MSGNTPPDWSARLVATLRAGPDGVVRAVDLVLAEADRLGASDVHFRPTPKELDIRLRIDGVLQRFAVLPQDVGPNIVARLKVLAELLTYRKDIPQEGSIRPPGGGPAVDRRVSTFPTVHGETVVVRVFDPSAGFLELDRIGLPNDILAGLDGLLRGRTGLVFLTGPSGSGKTTTIYACLRKLTADGPGRHTVTIEDPVERTIEGVCQSQARPGTEFDFARGLRSLLRQDPEVIMVGEVRDRETAAVAVEAALTGHLIFSTLHAGSACGVVGRLLEMGVEPYLLTAALRGILNQRLLRRLCDGCSGAGCSVCLGTGYRGRFLVAELLTPDAEFRRAVLRRDDEETLEAVVRRAGWRTIRDSAAAAVAEGRTTAAEVERVLGPRDG